LEVLLGMLGRAFAPVSPNKDEFTERPWMYPEKLKKFEDVSWAREQFNHMVRNPCLGVSAELEALKVLYEAQGKYHDPPRRGYRKV
jgi:hypothetical protein